MVLVLADLADGRVRVPGGHVTGFNVVKVKLQNSLDYEVPDPMLLAMKAAINWYYMMTGLKLLPACKPPEDPLKEEIRRAFARSCENKISAQRRWMILPRVLASHPRPTITPARVSLSPTGSQETTEEYDLNLTNEELSPCELFTLYDEIGDESDQD
ncbi:expressed unknown protein [Seminavis robusta]|uniref:Uncharacterized protein n=1 Tax=Seminavis robusta TaxID=568900 RepID=A0A9N8DHW4_9STRA|nr:expressed unknown protein [Seminavis robusta]|eukprot:Sro93_g048520.1 n/a (157) ;mRNA; r:68937-69407